MATTLGGYMLTKKKTVRYIKAFDIFNGIVESFTERTGFVSPLIKCDYLVIDSMELRKGSEFENRELNNIIDKRYDGLTKTTIIISNDTEHSIQAFLGSSAWSRASQCGGSIIFDGKCFRERG
jgi:DNA replication protein DnaC